MHEGFLHYFPTFNTLGSLGQVHAVSSREEILDFVHSVKMLSLNQSKCLLSSLSECQVEFCRHVGSLAVLRRVDYALPDSQLVR